MGNIQKMSLELTMRRWKVGFKTTVIIKIALQILIDQGIAWAKREYSIIKISRMKIIPMRLIQNKSLHNKRISYL